MAKSPRATRSRGRQRSAGEGNPSQSAAAKRAPKAAGPASSKRRAGPQPKRRDVTKTAEAGSPREAAGNRPPPKRRQGHHVPPAGAPTTRMRIAKAMARAGLCSRRDAERWIANGRVTVNGTTITSPALDVGPDDKIKVDGASLPAAEPTRLWRYAKPKGMVTTHRDPEGRATVFESLPDDMPRVMSVGRLDYNTEGLLLLTNSGELARYLELPSTGWLRRYRVRAHGSVSQADLDALQDGLTIEGVRYGPIEATLDSQQGANVWLTLGLREGKNREVRRILAHMGLAVNRLIRVSFGPFQLLDLKPGEVALVRQRILADRLGPHLAERFGLAGGQDDVDNEQSAPGKRPKPGAGRRQRPHKTRDAKRPARQSGSRAPKGGRDAHRQR